MDTATREAFGNQKHSLNNNEFFFSKVHNKLLISAYYNARTAIWSPSTGDLTSLSPSGQGDIVLAERSMALQDIKLA
jgi:hypothetical protein